MPDNDLNPGNLATERTRTRLFRNPRLRRVDTPCACTMAGLP
jgi:hypothetical protein